MARDPKSNRDILDTPGFKTPMPVGSEPGDAFDAPPAPAPGGPIPDPIGNIPAMRKGRKELPQ